MDKKITDSIIYIGVDDKDIDLFESQYVVPNGVSYNSYVIMDDKIAIMDTADARVTDKWFANLREALGDRKPDYLVVSHLEPDHASNIQKVAERPVPKRSVSPVNAPKPNASRAKPRPSASKWSAAAWKPKKPACVTPP